MKASAKESELAYETVDRTYAFMEMPNEFVMSIYDNEYNWQKTQYFPKTKYKTIQEAVKTGMLEKGRKVDVDELWKKLDKKKKS